MWNKEGKQKRCRKFKKEESRNFRATDLFGLVFGHKHNSQILKMQAERREKEEKSMISIPPPF